jgi:hypothetical protein
MLTVVFGASTFWMYKQYDETNIKLKAANEQLQTKDATLVSTESDLQELKRLVGAERTAKVAGQDGLSSVYDQDMNTYVGPTYADKGKGYRKALEYLSGQLKIRNGEVADAKTEIETWKRKYEAREAGKEPQVKQFQAEAKKAQEDLAAERDKFKADAEKLTKDQAELAARLETARKESDAVTAKSEAVLQEERRKAIALSGQLKDKNKVMDNLTKETFDVADGKILWVNQSNHIAWINLGRADALTRQINFSVYEGRTADINKAVRKGSIEVTQLLGDHLAEARILDDNLINPILPGDMINTPIWSPGEKRHFALAGLIDIDGDGKSDQALLRNLITMNGGIVDAEVDEKSGKIVGQVTAATRYLVQGDPPEGPGSGDRLKAYSKMLTDASTLGVATVKVKDLLAQMGWKSTTVMPTGMSPKGQAAPPTRSPTNVETPSEFRPRHPRPSAY